MRHFFIWVLFLIGFLLLSCSKKEAIYISGSTTVLPVVVQVAEAFKTNHNDFNIIINAGGSGVGINQLGENKTEIAMASRDLTLTEVNKYPKTQFNPIAIGKDAVVPVVSSEIYNAGVKALSLQDIAKIYSGEVTNWKTFGGPDKAILCIDKEASRGTRHIFMNAVFGDKHAEAPGADLVLGSNNEEQTALVQSDAAIGMLSYAWLNKDVKGLGIITQTKTILPSRENIINGSYPISRDLTLITNGDPEGKLKQFIQFILSHSGQNIVQKSGYVKLLP